MGIEEREVNGGRLDIYRVLESTLKDISFLIRTERSEAEIESLLASSLGQEMSRKIDREGRGLDGRFDSSRVERIVSEYIRELRERPSEGWARYSMNYILSEIFPETHDRDKSQDERFARGRLLFLQIMRGLYKFEEETIPFDPRRNLQILPESQLEGNTAQEYRRLKDLVNYGYIYEMLRIAADVTPFDTIGHMSGVHFVAMYAAKQLKAAGVPVDLPLISGAAMGHDIGKFGCSESEGSRVPYLHYYYTDVCSVSGVTPSHLCGLQSEERQERERKGNGFILFSGRCL